MAASGSSIRLRRLRQRFGISAPRLAIKAHVAWYWRVLLVLAGISVSLAFAAWMYETGRGQVSQRNESPQEIQSLRNHVMELGAELTRLRSLAGTEESNIQIEKATLRRLSQQVRALEVENSILKEDLAFFEGLMPSPVAGGGEGVRIDQLRIIPSGVPGEYRYRMLAVNTGGEQGKGFKGQLRFVVKVLDGGKDAMISVPSDSVSDTERFRIEIKYFNRLEGVFSVPLSVSIKSVEALLLQDGVVRAKQVAIL